MFSPKNDRVSEFKKSQSPSLKRRSLQLSTPLRSQVRSPGFSTRLSTLVRQNGGNSSCNDGIHKRLQPPAAAAAFNPKYQGFGSLPRVRLERRSLPRLSTKVSSQVRSPSLNTSRGPLVTVKVAPAEPFSPFKSNASLNSTPNGPENSSNIADPKRVLAALQELSRSRKRNRHGRRQLLSEEDDEEEDDDVSYY